MHSGKSFVSIFMTCVLAVALLGLAPVASSAGKASAKRDAGARSYTLEAKRRGVRGPRIPLPMGPSYIYYDYPYYYARGYYPRHIGGYVYYRGGYPKYSRRCSSSHRKCSPRAARKRPPVVSRR